MFQSWILLSLDVCVLTCLRPNCIHSGTEPRYEKLVLRILPQLPIAELSFFLKLVIWGIKNHLGAQSGIWKGMAFAMLR